MGGTGTKTAFTLGQYSSASKQSLVAAFTSFPTLPTYIFISFMSDSLAVFTTYVLSLMAFNNRPHTKIYCN